MGGRDGRAARGRARARELRTALGRELRDARLQHGLRLVDVGRVAGLSGWQVGRLERGDVAAPAIETLAIVCAAVGLELSVRVYPSGDPVRDAAHLALRGRFLACLHPSIRYATEVPLPIPGDLRAWDARLVVERRAIGVEFETRPRDVQALERRIARKARDGDVDTVVLVLADTRYNRELVRRHEATFSSAFPIAGRMALERLRSGRHPGGSAIVLR